MPSHFRYMLSLISFLFATAVLADEFKLSTSAFHDKGKLPALYTCDGQDISPQITWTKPPLNTKTFALIVTDPASSKGLFYHWILYNIPSNTTGVSQGLAKAIPGMLVGQNDYG